ncbi:hypothetical protein NLW78_05560 [Salirhabdus salicampi]|nr:hypothetical protein [Salirhabdus salicampi]
MNWKKALIVGVLMTAALTFVEHQFVQFTSYIVYYKWTWYYTFLSVLASILLTRLVVRLWFRQDSRKTKNNMKLPITG